MKTPFQRLDVLIGREGPLKGVIIIIIKGKVQFTTSPSVPSRGHVCFVWLSSFRPAAEEIDDLNKSLLEAEKGA